MTRPRTLGDHRGSGRRPVSLQVIDAIKKYERDVLKEVTWRA